MPGWNIHLEAGERVAKKLKLTGVKRREFLLGCVLPDINNGYINKVKVHKEHEETHYAYNQRSSLNFYAENREMVQRKEPIFLGYLLHLYTDGYFNYDFYRTIKRHKMGEGLDHVEKRKIKHHDFWLYDTCYNHHLGVKHEELDRLAKQANRISIAEITSGDIEDVERILVENTLNDELKGEKYLFYTKKRLDELLEDMIESFMNDYVYVRNFS
ncbi:zinc dependent phospholipase C family protein [Candidatus Saccharibacteria bacterium]|nr:zinc dependent phospholipase C family protein [Candidatus Saccharibacteria bacterium]